MFRTDEQWVGVQRKELKDFIASVQDGRLGEEVRRMNSCIHLGVKVLLIEGKAQWTNDGVFMGSGYGAQWTLAQHRGMLWSARSKGLWVDSTDSINETRVWLRMFEQWCCKAKHDALDRRPGARGAWGTPDSREYGLHLLQGLPGVGPELAGRVYDFFGGVPWKWAVTADELMKVPGIGKKRAQEMLNSLRG